MLIDLSDPTLYDGGATSLYTSYVTGTLEGLTRAAFLQGYYSDADRLIEALDSVGMVSGQRIALVGAQFGWVGERLIQRGYGPIADGTANGRVACIDTSAWIQANLSGNATVTIQNNDINNNTGRRAVKQSFGSANVTIDWCITHMLTYLVGVGPAPGGNNEIQPFCDSCRQLATRVAHWVTPLMSGPPQQDERLNWKTLEQWKSWVTPDYVVREGGGAIL